MAKVFYVTGTDTEVGKTIVSAALLKAFNGMGKTTTAMKPIASGCELVEGELRNADALLLQSHASVKLPYAVVNPFAFEPAIAPHIAAQEAQVELSSAKLLQHAQDVLEQQADICVVEGAGGYLVPLNQIENLSDFAIDLNGDVILVVAIRLGCINHALLTIKAIEEDGLKLAGWVANLCESVTGVNSERQQKNIASIQARTQAPLLAKVPKVINSTEQKTIEEVSKLFSEEQLQTLL